MKSREAFRDSFSNLVKDDGGFDGSLEDGEKCSYTVYTL